ncbi:hypothetical protein [Acidovorax kalamii]|uniref:hypothetical protein n=1 Tax=Acidovorax kalamii TaxID=2004485 RepID=UPI002090CAB1|nr:hypothetical protein [Acidovorax kalamii]MCO5358629.1 hypothetical protein [Acidovorax kalamii]
MFLTESCHQIHLLPASEHDQRFWRQITFASVSCKLLIEAVSTDSGCEVQSRTVLMAPSELEDLTRQCQVTYISLLSPGHVNRKGRWVLDPLAELWRCEATLPNGQTCGGWIHVLTDGRELLDCAGLNEMFEFRRTSCVYSSQAHQATSLASAH